MFLGQMIVSPWIIALKLKLTRKASAIKIGQLPLVKGTETRHILVSGGTGSGKSNCFHRILPEIRKQKQTAVIVEQHGGSSFQNALGTGKWTVHSEPFR